MEEFLIHYGTPRHSGRYPWGSGDNPYQHEEWFTGFKDNQSFLNKYHQLKSAGYSEKEIAKKLKITDTFGEGNTTKLRAKVSIARNNVDKYEVTQALYLQSQGYNTSEIAKKMGINESSVRGKLKQAHIDKVNQTDQTIDMLKQNVDQKKMIDVGEGTEYMLGVSGDKLKKSLAVLEEEGYQIHNIQIEQMGTKGQKTNMKILTGPDVTKKDVYQNIEDIKVITDHYNQETGKYDTDVDIEPPRSVSSSRLKINYAETGGGKKDGVIELRRGVEDLNLGQANYAQVRIAVDGSHYLKGMAMYSDNMPDGYDIIFNTSKHSDVPMMSDNKDNSVLKPLKKDKDNPFGASIKDDEDLRLVQKHYINSKGETELSAINVVSEEGNWGTWSKSLASQMLSKQPLGLVKRQLKIAYDEKEEEYKEIMELTNPTLQKKLLESFADDCDASAVHLKAAAMPRQGSYVILPIDGLKENEIYAPKYKNGEKVALIRYPHGGKFEIPELIVNNENASAKSLIPNAVDAVGINYKAAQRLSGADFDGDTVLVIPNNNGLIKTMKAFEGLKDFSTSEAYPAVEGMHRMTPKEKGREMGIITNLITDMTIKGASPEELERAVRHSMVVVDAEKHNLNYKQSEIDNGIDELKRIYQKREGGYGGSSTLISKAKSPVMINEVTEGKTIVDEDGKKHRYLWDPQTGEKLYTETGRTIKKVQVPVSDDPSGTSSAKTEWEYAITRKDGLYYKDNDGTYKKAPQDAKVKETLATVEVPKMSATNDARTLSSGYPVENAYASYANSLKKLANQARLSIDQLEEKDRNPSAVKQYQQEVASLNDKLKIALSNAPYERQAQLKANAVIRLKKLEDPNMSYDDLKKKKGQQLAIQRVKVGAKKQRIEITQNEWNAIQAGAVSKTLLSKIFDNTDLDEIKKLATPKKTRTISEAKIARIKSMAALGLTQAEIAEYFGISASSVSRILKGLE